MRRSVRCSSTLMEIDPVKGEGGVLSRALIERLALYYQIISRMGAEGRVTVSSASLAALLGIDSTLVRKDMAQAGVSGRPKVGYLIADVLRRLDDVLGLNSRKDAIIVGAGNLGMAVAAYSGFTPYGLKIRAIFDSDHKKVGQMAGAHIVLPVEKAKAIIENFRIEIAILTVPGAVAQEVVDWLVRRGIRAIWNFCPVQLQLPAGVVVRNENLAQGLAQLIHHFKQVKSQTPVPPAGAA